MNILMWKNASLQNVHTQMEDPPDEKDSFWESFRNAGGYQVQ